LPQASKETGFLGAFWWGDKDGLKKPGFSVALSKQPSKKTGLETGFLGWVTEIWCQLPSF